jgi:hypothetical protein
MPNQNQQSELGKLSPFLKNTQKSRQFTQSVVVGVSSLKGIMSVIEVLEEKLLGNFYSRVSLGDTFDLYFDHFCLIAQGVIAPQEAFLNNQLANFKPATEAIDKEDVAKGIILTSTLRKKVTAVSINPNSSLELCFENGIKLLFTTDNEIVDWQWAINENGQDPYHNLIVGVLESGVAQLGSC